MRLLLRFSAVVATSLLAVPASPAADPLPDDWAFRAFKRPAVPEIRNPQSAIRNDLDRFLLAKLAEQKLTYAPEEYNAVNLEQRRYEIITDVTDTTAAAFLGLTAGCARCHDHKYDPVTQRDYFRMQAFFAGYWPTDVPLLAPADRAEYEKKLA